MSITRAVIRYSFTENKDGGRRISALVTAFIQGNTEKSALSYLTKKYPERYNFEIIELIVQND